MWHKRIFLVCFLYFSLPQVKNSGRKICCLDLFWCWVNSITDKTTAEIRPHTKIQRDALEHLFALPNTSWCICTISQSSSWLPQKTFHYSAASYESNNNTVQKCRATPLFFIVCFQRGRLVIFKCSWAIAFEALQRSFKVFLWKLSAFSLIFTQVLLCDYFQRNFFIFSLSHSTRTCESFKYKKGSSVNG